MGNKNTKMMTSQSVFLLQGHKSWLQNKVIRTPCSLTHINTLGGTGQNYHNIFINIIKPDWANNNIILFSLLWYVWSTLLDSDIKNTRYDNGTFGTGNCTLHKDLGIGRWLQTQTQLETLIISPQPQIMAITNCINNKQHTYLKGK